MSTDRRVVGGAAAVAVAVGVGLGTVLAWTPRVRERVAPDAPAPEAAAPPDVTCQLDPAPGPRRIALEEHDPAALTPLGPVAVAVDGDWITFRPRHAEGLGRLTVDGYAPAALGWLDGACLDLVTLAPVDADARVYGTVRGAEPADLAVRGCGRGVMVGADGTFDLVLPPGEPCEVTVARVFGTRLLTGQGVTVHPTPGLALALTLRAPDPPGAAGWDLLETDDGFRVAAVLPGGPAARAGVEVSDRVLRVGDTPATELAEEDAIEVPLPVEVELAGDSGARVVTLAP